MAGRYMKPIKSEKMLDLIKSQISESAATKTAILNDSSITDAINRAAQACIKAYRNGGKTLFAGNGGSAADAQHLAGEFVSKFYFDRPGLPSIALTTDTSILTAIGNDYGFDRLFARQVQAQGVSGDVFIGISTSGNSSNIVEAIKECKEKGILTVSLTGAKPCLMDEADIVIKVPSTSTPRIQECQTMIGHIICCIVEQEIFGHLKK